MRKVVLLALMTALPVLAPAPAWAFCQLQPLSQLAKDSDAVWWVTVTDASASLEGKAGLWQLTVQLDDVLKGPGSDLGMATAYTAACGPYITDEGAASMAPDFVGQHRLLLGSVDRDGSMIAYSDFVTPQGLTPQEQYARALDALGLEQPVDVDEGTGPPAVATSSTAWWPWALAVVVVAAVGGGLLLVIRRKRLTAPPVE